MVLRQRLGCSIAFMLIPKTKAGCRSIDAFACPALFLWHTGKSVSRDVIPKSSEFSPEHYATFVAYPALFHKYREPFLCLVGMSQMDLMSFIRIADPMKVRIGERQRDEDEPKLLETTIGRVVLLLPAEQGDSASGGHGFGIDVVAETIVEDVAPAQLKCQKKRKTKVADAGDPSHPAKKLMDDYRAPDGPIVRGGVMPTLPFISSSVSTMLEREGGDHIELLAGANLHTIGASQRFVISSDSSDHSGVNIMEAEVDYVVRTYMPIITGATTTTPTADPVAIAKEKLVGFSLFGAYSPSAGGSHPILGGFSDCTVPQWNVTNGSFSDDGDVCHEMVDEFAPPKFFASVCGIKHEQLFSKFNVGVARQMSLSAEVRMHAEYNIRERRRLNSIVKDKDALLKAKDKKIRSLKRQRKSRLEVTVDDLATSVKIREQEVADLDAVVTSVKLQNDNLVDQVHKLETSSVRLQEKVTAYENCLS
nr:hypothetical protein [Tanacetum cinerariifolium]